MGLISLYLFIAGAINVIEKTITSIKKWFESVIEEIRNI
jgi:hypothetical protein